MYQLNVMRIQVHLLRSPEMSVQKMCDKDEKVRLMFTQFWESYEERRLSVQTNNIYSNIGSPMRKVDMC